MGRSTAPEDVAAAFGRTRRLMASGVDVHVTDIGLRIEDAERVHQATFAELADRWSGRDLRLDLSSLLRGWVLSRPVTDGEAMKSGVAVLTWTSDPLPVWTVMVARGRAAVPWVAMLDGVSKQSVERLAFSRAARHPTVETAIGEMTLWSSAIHPALSTAIIASADWLEERQVRDEYLVIAPDQPKGLVSAPYEEAERLRQTISQPVCVRHSSQIESFRWC